MWLVLVIKSSSSFIILVFPDPLFPIIALIEYMVSLSFSEEKKLFGKESSLLHSRE